MDNLRAWKVGQAKVPLNCTGPPDSQPVGTIPRGPPDVSVEVIEGRSKAPDSGLTLGRDREVHPHTHRAVPGHEADERVLARLVGHE